MLGNQLEKLENKSKKAVSIFQETIDNLSKTNEEITLEIKKKSTKVDELEFEITELQVLRANNERVIEKISSVTN